jgi:hypothetical protein
MALYSRQAVEPAFSSQIRMEFGSRQQSCNAVMQTLRSCGFLPLGTITQGSGLRGRALSADGTVWADFTVSRVSFRRGLRRFFREGRLCRSEINLGFHTELNNGSQLETRAEAMRPALGLESFAVAAVQTHMRMLETQLLEFSPLKPLVLLGLPEVLEAERRASLRVPRIAPLTVDTLAVLGVAPHLARLIAGPCADQRETLSI